MVEFATSIFIMDAGPEQAIAKNHTSIWFISQRRKMHYVNRVHGPREGGATFLAQFATKEGMNTQLLTSTLGPLNYGHLVPRLKMRISAINLYRKIGPREARRVLANLFPSGSARTLIEDRLATLRTQKGIIDEEIQKGVSERLVVDIIKAYTENPNVKHLPA